MRSSGTPGNEHGSPRMVTVKQENFTTGKFREFERFAMGKFREFLVRWQTEWQTVANEVYGLL